MSGPDAAMAQQLAELARLGSATVLRLADRTGRVAVLAGTSGILAAARVAKKMCRNAFDTVPWRSSAKPAASTWIPSSNGLSTAASTASIILTGAG